MAITIICLMNYWVIGLDVRLEHFQSPCSGAQYYTRNIKLHGFFVFPEKAAEIVPSPHHNQVTNPGFSQTLKAKCCTFSKVALSLSKCGDQTIEAYSMWGRIKEGAIEFKERLRV